MIYYSVTINVQYITIFRLKKALGSVAARGGEGRCFFGFSFLVGLALETLSDKLAAMPRPLAERHLQKRT
jgi:hypothetical protein